MSHYDHIQRSAELREKLERNRARALRDPAAFLASRGEPPVADPVARVNAIFDEAIAEHGSHAGPVRGG